MKKYFFVTSCIALCFFKLSAQVSKHGSPITIPYTINIQAKISLPYIDNFYEAERSDSIAGASCQDCKSKFYGVGINSVIDIKEEAQLDTVIFGDDSVKVWLLEVESETAYGMQFYFDEFNLPNEAALYFYNEEKTMVLGAFTSDNTPPNPEQEIKFGTQYIKGRRIIIEYEEPMDVEFAGQLQITKIIHVFRNLWGDAQSGPYGSSEGCHINVKCPLGTGWENEINSVALILAYNSSFNYVRWCSGALINNTQQNGEPLFLTAAHCINGTDPMYDYSTWLFLFNHQASTCAGDGSDAPTSQSVYGSTLLSADGAGSPTSDFALLRLNTDVQTLTSYGACFAGWDREDYGAYTSPYTVLIHHPAGDVKKISKDNGSPVSYNAAMADFWEVTFDQGATENGSSGSPLFNSNHRIVGQLWGGYSRCLDFWIVTSHYCPTCPDYCGKLSTSWQEGGLGWWLDPYNTNATSVNTYCPAISNPPPPPIGGGGSGGCESNLTDGFRINSIPTGVPCVEMPLVLTPLEQASPCQFSYWDIVLTERKRRCSHVHEILTHDGGSSTSSLCNNSFPDPWNCWCKWAEYFIEITPVNESFSPTGPAISQWFSIQVDYSVLEYYLFAALGSVTVTQTDLSYMGVTLLPGNLYKIKLAGGFNSCCGWHEYTRIFRYKPQDITWNSTYLCQNVLRGEDITLTTTVDPSHCSLMNIFVKATQSITVLPNSKLLKTSTYEIEDVCYMPPLANPDNPNNPNNPDNNYNNQYNVSTLNINFAETMLTDKSNGENFYIYPNPTSGKLDIVFSRTDSPLDDGPYRVNIYDIMGNLIYHGSFNSDKTSLSLNDYSDGIYLITINDIYRKKLIISKN